MAQRVPNGSGKKVLQLMDIADFITAGIFISDEDLRIKSWNKWLILHTNIKEEDAVDRRIDELFRYINSGTLKRKIRTCLSLNTNTFYNPPEGYLIKIKNDRVIETPLEYAYQTIKIIPYDLNKRLALIIVDDQTAIKEAYLKLEKLKNEADNHLDIIDKNVCTVIVDNKGVITDVSFAMCKLSGYDRSEIIGSKPNIFRHHETDNIVFRRLWSTLQSGGTWRGEYKNLKKNGETYWIKSTVFPVPNARSIKYQAIVEDVTDRKKLETISITDELTGLFNRRHFNSLFAIELQKAKYGDDTFAFFMLDIDHFKGYNDYYGHLNGDAVLSNVAKVIKEIANDYGESFRLGGEEFGVMVSGVERLEIEKLAESIRREIEALGIENSRNSASKFITASIGVFFLDFSTTKSKKIDTKDVYAKADGALYEAKNSGKNRFVFSS